MGGGWVAWCSWLCQGVGLSGHGDEGGGDLLETGFDVGGGGWSGGVGMPGVGPCDSVAVVSFDPGEGGVAEPVGGDALGSDPGESFAESFPEVVVASAGEGMPVAVAEQGFGGEDGAAGCGVVDQAVRERGVVGCQRTVLPFSRSSAQGTALQRLISLVNSCNR